MTGPLVSIITPAYNVGEYINECIDSVLAQSYTNWELIILVAPSTDDTLQKALSYNDKRIMVWDEAFKNNVATSRNTGLEICCGECVAFLDADDWWISNKLQVMMNYISGNPHIEWVAHYLILSDKKIELFEHIYPGHDTAIGGVGACLFRKDLLNEVKKERGYVFDENMNRNDDADLVLYLRNRHSVLIPHHFSYMRMRNDSLNLTTGVWQRRWIIFTMCWRNRAYDILWYHLKEMVFDVTGIVRFKKRWFDEPERITS